MSKATIYYHNIGDYLSREEKLDIISKFGSIANPQMEWQTLEPNEHGDWLNQRNDIFGTFIPIEPEKKFDLNTKTFFNTYSLGVSTNRDAWVYNFSKAKVENNMQRMIDFYNQQRIEFYEAKSKNQKLTVEDFIDTNPTKISWTRALRKDAEKSIKYSFKSDEFSIAAYRPFCKQYLYFDKPFIESPGLSSQFFSNTMLTIRVICISPSPNDGLSLLISDKITNLHFNGDTQCFPLYYYEEIEKKQRTLFDSANENELIRRDGISDFILQQAHKQYGVSTSSSAGLSKEDIFYYVYGFLHSPEYRTAFASDLKKMLPRIPLVDDVKNFWALSKAGRKLAELHLNYESVPPYEGVKVNGAEILSFIDSETQDTKKYLVDKMRFPSKDDKSRIIYNSYISIENIPAQAYEYIVNGKSAIEWIMERYQVTINKDSGIKNDPNDWATEVGNPRYILDLLLSIIRVSVETVEIVKCLPKLKF